MIRLHHCPQTRSMRTLWLLHELGIPFEVETYPFDQTLRRPEYRALNPLSRVPALEIDGAAMMETGAMTELLCERYPEAGMGRLVGDPERREWLVWVHFAETISQHSAALTQQHVAIFEDHMRSPVVMKLEAKRLAKCFGVVDDCLSDGREYLLETGFSAADISVGQAVYMGAHFVELHGFEHLKAWFCRFGARKGYRAALPKSGEGRLYGQRFYAPWEAG